MRFKSTLSLFYRNDPMILGENNGNLPRIVFIIAETFVKEAISTDTDVAKRMINIVRQIQVSSYFLLSPNESIVLVLEYQIVICIMDLFPMHFSSLYFN